MMRWLVPTVIFLAAFAASGWTTLNAIPGFIMDKAMSRISASGGGQGGARHAPRLTENNQTIVRASPDILYSVCAYDLSDGDRRITAPWPADGNYASVSLYDANTNNFAVISDRDGAAVDIRLTDEAGRAGDDALVSPTRQGLILYRRVVDAQTDLDAADAERRGFTCERVTER